MSWDALIAKTSDPHFSKPAEDAALLPMGKPSDIQAKLNASVPSISWTTLSDGHAYFGSLSLEFSLGGETGTTPGGAHAHKLAPSDEVTSIGVSARGAGDPVSVVIAIAKANHWSVADAQEGNWIDLNAPSQKSWREFTEYRDKVASGSNKDSHGSIAINLAISCAFFVVIAICIKYFAK